MNARATWLRWFVPACFGLIYLMQAGCSKPSAPPAKDNAEKKPEISKAGGAQLNRAPVPSEGGLTKLIPGHGVGFAVIKVSEVWQSEQGREAQKLLAGEPKLKRDLKGLEEVSGLKPEQIEYAGGIMMNIEKGEPPLLLVSAKQDLDPAKVQKMFRQSEKETYLGKELIVEKGLLPKNLFIGKGKAEAPKPEKGRVLYFAGKQAFLMGSYKDMTAYLDALAKGPGPLTPAVMESAKHQAFIAFTPNQTPLKAEAPPEFQPIVAAQLAWLAGDIGTEWTVQAHLSFADETQAKAAEKPANDGLSIIRGQLAMIRKSIPPQGAAFVNKPLEDAENGLKKASIERTGSALGLTASAPIKLQIDDTVLQRAVNRVKHQNNLKQFALAWHNYCSTFGDKLPPAAICDAKGKPLLSWRVAILPYIEEDALYRQFKFDEAWDGPNNKKLLEKMPKIYALPGVTSKEPYTTHYRCLVGPGTLFPGKTGPTGNPSFANGLISAYTIANIPDGTSNTVMIAEAADAVPWSKPDELQYDPKKPLPKFGKQSPDGFWVAMGDGSVHFVKKTVSEKTLRSAINPSDGMPLGSDW